MSWWRPSDVGLAVRGQLADAGLAARLFWRLIRPVSYTHLTLPTNREV